MSQQELGIQIELDDFMAAPRINRYEKSLVVAERIRERVLMQTVMMVAEAKPSNELINAVSTIFSDTYDDALRSMFVLMRVKNVRSDAKKTCEKTFFIASMRRLIRNFYATNAHSKSIRCSHL